MNEKGLTTFRLRQRLAEQDNMLVQQAEGALNPEMVDRLHAANAKLSQFSELLNTALQAPSAPVVAEWVRYQMSRGATRGQWGEGTKLGETVLADISTLREKASALALSVYPPDRAKEGTREVWIELVRRYTGWLRRRFVAEMGGGADDEQA